MELGVYFFAYKLVFTLFSVIGTAEFAVTLAVIWKQLQTFFVLDKLSNEIFKCVDSKVN